MWSLVTLLTAFFFLIRREIRLANQETIRKLLDTFHKGHGYPTATAEVTPSPAPAPVTAGELLPARSHAPRQTDEAPIDAEVLDLANITLRLARSATQGIHYQGGTVAIMPYTPEQRVRVEALAARWGSDVPDTVVRLLQIALDEDPPPPKSSLN